MSKCFLISSLFFCIAACNSAENNAAGGPCKYVFDSIPARIIAIDSIDNTSRNLVLVLEKKAVYITDTIDYYAAFNHHITPEDLQERDIAVNDSLIFIAAKMITGSCNPVAGSSLLLEHYKK